MRKPGTKKLTKKKLTKAGQAALRKKVGTGDLHEQIKADILEKIRRLSPIEAQVLEKNLEQASEKVKRKIIKV